MEKAGVQKNADIVTLVVEKLFLNQICKEQEAERKEKSSKKQKLMKGAIEQKK